jgi:hypothetical protein
VSDITRPAGQRIAKAVRKIERLELPPEPSKPPNNLPIILVKAKAEIAKGSSGPVKQLVRKEYDRHAKGDEDEIQSEFQVYNRFGDLASGEEFFARWIDGGYERISGGSSTTTTGEGCGGCNDPAGNLIIDLDGLLCSDRYSFSPMCGGLLPITFVYDSGSDWIGGPGDLMLSCDSAGEVDVTATLEILGVDVGDVTITISDGTNTWTWKNDTAFDPGQPVAMRRMTGPVDCPCSTWRPYPCLTPLDAA